jgi:IS5 family transposase
MNANALLAAAGYNFRRILRWMRLLLRIILALLSAPPKSARA